MKYFKLLLSLFVLLCLAFCLYAYYDSHLSPQAQKNALNEQRAHSVKAGMRKEEVKRIMGEPVDITQSNDPLAIVSYHYLSNNGDFLDIEIRFDTDQVVSSVFIP